MFKEELQSVGFAFPMQRNKTHTHERKKKLTVNGKLGEQKTHHDEELQSTKSFHLQSVIGVSGLFAFWCFG